MRALEITPYWSCIHASNCLEGISPLFVQRYTLQLSQCLHKALMMSHIYTDPSFPSGAFELLLSLQWGGGGELSFRKDKGFLFVCLVWLGLVGEKAGQMGLRPKALDPLGPLRTSF